MRSIGVEIVVAAYRASQLIYASPTPIFTQGKRKRARTYHNLN